MNLSSMNIFLVLAFRLALSTEMKVCSKTMPVWDTTVIHFDEIFNQTWVLCLTVHHGTNQKDSI